MTTSKADDFADMTAQATRDSLKARIGRNVVRGLGSPGGIFRVLVHAVGEGSFRVNVLMGSTAATARIAKSYFVTTDEEGNITTSSPEIVVMA